LNYNKCFENVMKKSKQLYLIHHFDLCRMFLRMYVSHNPKTFYNIGLYHITQKLIWKTFCLLIPYPPDWICPRTWRATKPKRKRTTWTRGKPGDVIMGCLPIKSSNEEKGKWSLEMWRDFLDEKKQFFETLQSLKLSTGNDTNLG